MSKDIKDLQSKILFLNWKKIELNLNKDLRKNKNFWWSWIVLSSIQEINSKNDLSKETLTKLQNEKEVLNQNLFKLEKEISEQKNKIENIKNKKNEIQRFLETVQKDKNNEKNNLKEIVENIKKTEIEITNLNSRDLKKRN